MIDYTIANEYTLPSEGKVYSQNVVPQFKLRSMTTVEEMKRLNHSDKPYKTLAEILDDCLVEDIGISAYDLCLADYQYMLHKLRIVTYGPSYKVDSVCPYCGSTNHLTTNLDELTVKPLNKELFDKAIEFVLPVSKKLIRLRMQTPRMLDNNLLKTKEEKRLNSSNMDPSFLIGIESMIETIDGEKPEEFRLRPFIQKLPMMDTNYILQSAEKLTNCLGLESTVDHTCSICGLTYKSNFRTTSEFFRPSID